MYSKHSDVNQMSASLRILCCSPSVWNDYMYRGRFWSRRRRRYWESRFEGYEFWPKRRKAGRSGACGTRCGRTKPSPRSGTSCSRFRSSPTVGQEPETGRTSTGIGPPGRSGRSTEATSPFSNRLPAACLCLASEAPVRARGRAWHPNPHRLLPAGNVILRRRRGADARAGVGGPRAWGGQALHGRACTRVAQTAQIAQSR